MTETYRGGTIQSGKVYPQKHHEKRQKGRFFTGVRKAKVRRGEYIPVYNMIVIRENTKKGQDKDYEEKDN